VHTWLCTTKSCALTWYRCAMEPMGRRRSWHLAVTSHHFIPTFSIYIFCFLCHLGPHLGWCMFGDGLGVWLLLSHISTSLVQLNAQLYCWGIARGSFFNPTGSMVVVEILEGHVMVRFEDLFFGAPHEVWVFILLLTTLMFLLGGFCLCHNHGKKEALNWKLSTLVF